MGVGLEFDEVVGAGAEGVGGGGFDGVDAVAGVHAFDEGGFAWVGGVFDGVVAGLVEGDGVEGGEDAEVGHFGGFGVGVAVAVDGEVVGDVDVGEVFGAFVFEDGLYGVGHGFEEGVLGREVFPEGFGVFGFGGGGILGLEGLVFCGGWVRVR